VSTSPDRLVAELSGRHRHIAVLAAHDVLGDWALAEDAAQLAFLLILNRLRGGDPRLLDRPEATVRRNARWAALKIRDARLHAQTAEDRCGRISPDDDSGPWSSAEARLVCEGILAALPDHYREAIQLRFFRDLPDAAAADRLHVTLRAYRRRLDRALAMARSLAADVGPKGAAAILAVHHGVRALRDRLRRAADLGDVWGTPVATTTALLVIAASPGGPAAAALPLLAAAPSPGGGLPGAPLAVAPVGATSSRGGVVVHAALTAPVATASAVPGRLGITAADETPQDTTIYSAAATPGSQGSGAAVAVGRGHACGCSVVFESRDGWHGWRAAAGPDLSAVSPQTRVALPPAYPADPRILLGSPAVSAIPDMVAPGFGADFTALPFTGWITVPWSFESDGTLFVATAGGLSRIGLTGVSADPAGTRPVVFIPPLMAGEVSAAAAPGSAVTFALSGQGSRVASVAAEPVGAYSVESTGGVPEFYTCSSAGGSCHRTVSSPTSLPVGMAVSPTFATDHALAVYGMQRDIHLSADSGTSFTTLPDPGGSVAWVAPATVNGAVTVWAVVARSGVWTVMQWLGRAGWHTVSPASWHPAALETIHPLLLAPDRVVILDDGADPVCTADAGRTWATACPA